MRLLDIFEQIDPPPCKGSRYRLVENIQTTDGIRSRLTSHCTDSLEEARKWIAQGGRR